MIRNQQDQPHKKIAALQKELKAKNRELEIEASLEKVRSSALKMNNPEDMLKVCKIISEQLQFLGVNDIRNVQTAIINEQKNTYFNYQYFTAYKKGIVEEAEYNKHSKARELAETIKKSAEAFFSQSFRGKSLNGFRHYRDRDNQFPDPLLSKAKSVNFYFYSFGPGALGLSTYNTPLSKEDLNLLRRFRNVFELAYRRFVDIELALAQAKEAKTEAALEKVRAVAMSMNKPDDLLNICEVLYQEFHKLGFDEMRNAMINIHNDEKKTFLNYDYSDEIGKSITPLFYQIHPVIEKQIKQIRSADNAFSETVFEGKDLESWKEFRRSRGEKDDPRIKSISALHYYFYSIGTGSIGISTFSSIGEEKLELLKRFRNVFNLSYQRYLDIALAEAQAREAQIQLAMERVRARTMAMQRSDELPGAATILFQQVQSLGMPAFAAGYCIWDEDKQAITLWMSSEGILQPPFKAPTTEDELFIEMRKGHEEGKSFHVVEMGGKKLVAHYQYMRTLPVVGEIFDSIIEAGHPLPTFQIMHHAYFSKGFLLFITYEPVPEAQDIFKRFAKVFEQTYTRFLDLQKAEAQAREAKIEVCLEKVRARTMAMQNSNELVDTSTVLFHQLKILGIETIRTGVATMDEENETVEVWSTSGMSGNFEKKILGIVPANVHPMFTGIFNSWKNKEPYFAYELKGNKLKKYYKALSSYLSYPEQKLFNEREMIYTFFFPEGSLNVVSHKALTEEECNVMMRFANVFGLVYTRFLDLKQAEAQAREAQIETALERVRTRSMAMHKSDELLDVIKVVSDQLHQLNIKFQFVSFGINNQDSEFDFWLASPGFVYPERLHVPYMNNPIPNTVLEAQKKGLSFFSNIFTMEENKQWLQLVFDSNETTQLPEKVKNYLLNSPGFARSAVMLKNINIFLGNYVPKSYTDEENDILIRFANVFEQSYIRFLDLQKAEVQARESQIEAALERVRAKAMAMHTSNDLSDTMGIVFTELPKLGINSLRCGVVLLSKDSHRAVFYAAATTFESDSFTMIGTGDMAEHPEFVNQYEFWLRNENYFTTLSDEELQSYYEALFARLSVPYKPREHKIKTEHGYYFAFSAGMFYAWAETPYSENEVTILNRFKTIFDLTFRRYLDLQKAEAQAKEAQIELALERVRARTMAMHRSEELSETAHVLFQQFKEIDKEPKMLTIGIMNENEGLIEFWVTDWSGGGSKVNRKFNASIHEPILLNNIINAWKDKQKSIVIELSNEELLGWVKYRISLSGVPDNTDYSTSRGFVAAAFFSKGMLSISTYEPFSLETIMLLERFAGVFNLTYTRFLDLQQAEAQSREAQIELGLERVRARAMAMQKSDELAELIDILQKELVKLEFTLNNCIFWIMEEESPSATWWIATVNKTSLPESYRVPFSNLLYFKSVSKAWKERIVKWVYELKGNDKKEVDQYIFTETDLARFPDEVKKAFREVDKVYISFSFYNYGGLHISTKEPLTDEQLDIVNRFSKVFDMTYTRFLDLQKAEAQARESQIQLALERVRARTMAMQRSEELKDVAAILFKHAEEVGVNSFASGVHLWIEEGKAITVWSCTEGEMLPPFRLPLTDDPAMMHIYEASKSGKDFHVEAMGGQALNEHYEYLFSFPNIKKIFENLSDAGFPVPKFQIFHAAYFSHGYIMFITHEPCLEVHDIFKRFAKVFEQAYIRFLDLQKAEAQARESQIETALERIRARTMAMHKSDELSETAFVLFQQFTGLGISVERIFIGIILDDKQVIDCWGTEQGGNQLSPHFEASIDEPNGFSKIYAGWKEKKKSIIIHQSGKELTGYINYLREMGVPFKEELVIENRYQGIAYFSKGLLGISTPEIQSQETINILERFAGVFDLTYTRFLDLQKAEEQAREANIEASLERVRSKAMAMHNTNDLSETVNVFFKELKSLGIIPIRCGVGQIDEATKTTSLTITTSSQLGDSFQVIGKVKQTGHPVLDGIFDHWKLQKEYYPVLEGEDIKAYYDVMNPQIGYPDYPEEMTQYGNNFPFKEGFVFAWTENRLSEGELIIFRRFTSVLSLTYRRYMDLKEAETQAKEAKIEASLERIRSHAMAMRTSDDLSLTVKVYFKELKALGMVLLRCGVAEYGDEPYLANITVTSAKAFGDSFQVLGSVKQVGHPVLEGIYEHWVRQEEFFPVLQGQDLHAYNQVVTSKIDLPKLPEDTTEYGYYFYFKEGSFFVWAQEKLSEDAVRLFRRFSSVLSLTYRRYIDLKESEKRAIEAVKQASLDRVRAEIASMRTAEDLNHITPIIWRELKTLEVPFFRCGVYIVDETNSKVQVYLTTPDGKPLAVLHLTSESNELTKNTVEYWRKQKVYKDHWNKEEFLNWTKLMIEQGQVQNAETYQGSLTPPESLYLHFVPFKQGMLYVGDTSPLSDEKLHLVKSLAETFSIAYSRYEDFKNLENAKEKVEVTLSELKSAQAQLIHSEKMASLGELTAGIAHEIKNPLNFVNNFSEVSWELLDEMKIEIKNNNIEEVIKIVGDLKQNLEKINTHGKRADSIVKGMLLHSRGTSGEKTLTDINDLLDQYINLAYHGIRAQNKEFNITIEKDYDNTLEKINVVPQDISRVFLNIVNNACYAANEKKKQSGNNFSPTLRVSTKKLNSKVEIRISDNGNGIPESIIEQIFNPFFTTKPTGEGTGLGLSLSYDIVTKVHGGDIKVESEDGKGAEFIIRLPNF